MSNRKSKEFYVALEAVKGIIADGERVTYDSIVSRTGMNRNLVISLWRAILISGHVIMTGESLISPDYETPKDVEIDREVSYHTTQRELVEYVELSVGCKVFEIVKALSPMLERLSL